MRQLYPIIFRKASSWLLLSALILLAPFIISAQNILQNSGFGSGNSNWNCSGMNVEINPETTYGGGNSNNKTAEVDAQVGLRQRILVIPGYSYTLTFKASRRKNNNTPASPGIAIKVIGAITGTLYINSNKTYSNTNFSFTTQSYSFTVPLSSLDVNLDIQLTHYNNVTTFGVVLDDVLLFPNLITPVKMISFTGEIKEAKGLLTWITENEINNKGFVIERSVNGTNFDSIGVIAAANNAARHIYSFTDVKPAAAINYYRLRQVDIDGAYKISTVVTLRLAREEGKLQLFPIPAQATISYHLALANSLKANLVIFNIHGKIMMQRQETLSAGINQHALDISGLTKGVYFLQIASTEGSLQMVQEFSKM